MHPRIIRCDTHLSREELLKLKEKYTLLLPGDPCPKNGAILLFPLPFFTFYDKIFPLLREIQLPALLGISPRYILESTSLPKESRLKTPPSIAMQDGIFDTQAPFCTWQEICEMVTSCRVEVASHSFSLMNLTFPFVDLRREILHSKEVLEKRVPQAISSFIFPFGKTNPTVTSYVRDHYQFGFR